MVDLAGAILGWLVADAGAHGVRRVRDLVVGDDQERALRDVVKRAVAQAAELAPEDKREHLRAVLAEHEAPSLSRRPQLRGLVRDWVASLSEPVDYFAEIGLDPERLVDVLAQRIRQGVEDDAARGGPLGPLAGRFRHTDVMAGFHQLGEKIDAIHEAPPVGPPRQLPHDRADFVGRAPELATLRAQAGGRRGALVISAVAGQPGVGKSTLAVHFAHQLADQYPDAHLYADLRGADARPVDSGDVLGAFLRALGMRQADIPARTQERAAAYRSLLSGKRALILLDNAVDEAQVRPLLPGSATCLVLVTSRRDLVLDGAEPLVLHTMTDEDGLALLTELAGAQRVAAERDAAEQVVRLCGGLPLAIRIVGARARKRPSWPLAHLVDRLAEERRRLAEIRAGDLDVRASFALSYQELGPAEAVLFRRLGTVPIGEFDARLAAALVDGDADTLLETLADAHLVEPVAPGRYRIHDLLRLYARERLAADDDPASTDEVVIRWYAETTRAAVETGLGGRSDDESPAAQAALAWLDAEWEAIAAIFEWAEAAGAVAHVDELRNSLSTFLAVRGNLAALERFDHAVLAYARRSGNRAAETAATMGLGQIAASQSRYDEAVTWYQTEVRAAEEAGEDQALVYALVHLGRLYAAIGDQASRRAVASRLRGLIPAARGYPHAAMAAEFIANLQSTYELRRKWLIQARDLAVETGVPAHVAETLLSLGRLAVRQGYLAEARRNWTEALAYARQDSVYADARAHALVGDLCLEARLASEARTHLAEALRLWRRLADPGKEAYTLVTLGKAHLLAGSLDEAASVLTEALSRNREIGEPLGEGWALYLLARCHLDQGRYEAAEAATTQAERILRPLDPEAPAAVEAIRQRLRQAKRGTGKPGKRQRSGRGR